MLRVVTSLPIAHLRVTRLPVPAVAMPVAA
jgi:hypothetical protein